MHSELPRIADVLTVGGGEINVELRSLLSHLSLEFIPGKMQWHGIPWVHMSNCNKPWSRRSWKWRMPAPGCVRVPQIDWPLRSTLPQNLWFNARATGLVGGSISMWKTSSPWTPSPIGGYWHWASSSFYRIRIDVNDLVKVDHQFRTHAINLHNQSSHIRFSQLIKYHLHWSSNQGNDKVARLHTAISFGNVSTTSVQIRAPWPQDSFADYVYWPSVSIHGPCFDAPFKIASQISRAGIVNHAVSFPRQRGCWIPHHTCHVKIFYRFFSRAEKGEIFVVMDSAVKRSGIQSP